VRTNKTIDKMQRNISCKDAKKKTLMVYAALGFSCHSKI
jgi:hypothetical protein